MKVNQPTQTTASTSELPLSGLAKKGTGRGRVGVIGTLSKGENAKQGKNQRKIHIILYVGPSFLVAEMYVVGLKLCNRDCGLDLQIHRYIELTVTFL